MALGVIGAIVGELRMYAGAGATTPLTTVQELETGWLLCNGAAVSRSTYSDLFSKIGTFYGIGDGSTTFNLPDITQRFPLGRARAGTGAGQGVTGGELTHTLITGELASHTHTGVSSSVANHSHTGSTGTDNPDHTHQEDLVLDNGPQGFQPYTGLGFISFFYSTSGSHNSGITQQRHSHAIIGDGGHSHSLAIDVAGSGSAHNNMPPFQTVHFLIKT